MARRCGKMYGFCKHFSIFCDQIYKEVVYSFKKNVSKVFFVCAVF